MKEWYIAYNYLKFTNGKNSQKMNALQEICLYATRLF